MRKGIFFTLIFILLLVGPSAVRSVPESTGMLSGNAGEPLPQASDCAATSTDAAQRRTKKAERMLPR